MAYQGTSHAHLLTPALAAQDYIMPLLPLREKAYCEALPDDDMRLLAIPSMMNAIIDEDKIPSSRSRGLSLRPKIRVIKGKRLFDDVTSRMANQGATKLDFCSGIDKEGESPKATLEKSGFVQPPCKQELGYENPHMHSSSLGYKRRRTTRRRNSNAAVCA